MGTSDFLLEVGTEEIPARFMDSVLEQLKELTAKTFEEQRLSYDKIYTYGTPRRIVLHVTGLSPEQESLLQEVKGPAAKVAFNEAGEASRAAQGFAKSQGVSVEDLIIKPVGPVEYVFAVKKEEGRPTPEVLAEISPTLISGLHFPKPMRWGDMDLRFARPIRWLVALYGQHVVEFDFAGLKAGRLTYGHRFLSKGTLEVKDAQDYLEKIRAAYVMVDPVERRETIWRQVQELANAEGGRVEPDDDLLAEITHLVEFPTALCGSFAESYLELPQEVLVTPMREHQRYFPVVGPNGCLQPKFIAVRNGTEEHIEIVRAGNEKVLRARLADAAFFWEEDLKTPLSERVDALKKIVWQESLGTVYEKVERIRVLALKIGQALNAAPDVLVVASKGAVLSKADLVTNMVYEFPELQGIMGREYALRSGEEEAVAQAIYEHYLPRFAGDDLPATLPGQILSLADKFDTIIGCFAIGIQPTGSQDPYALRRQALGISHIIMENQLALSLREQVARAYEGYRGKVELKNSVEQVAANMEEFFRQRLRGIFSDRGLAYDTIEAVLASGSDDLTGTWQRAEALAEFRKEPAFNAVLTAFNRANNLSKKHDSILVDPKAFIEPAEEQLYKTLTAVSAKVDNLLNQRDYSSALREMATLQRPVDNFFDAVMVMVDDERVRANRLGMLKGVAALAQPLADLTKLVVAS